MSLLIHPKRGPKGSGILKIHSVSYSRNGIGGIGFHHIEFDMKGDSTRFDTIPNKRPPILRMHAVIINSSDDDTGPLEAFVTTPGMPNAAWRGTDHFGPALKTIIRASKWPHELKKA